MSVLPGTTIRVPIDINTNAPPTVTTTPLATTSISNLGFLEVLMAIIIGWMLVTLWQRVLDNFTFQTLGLKQNSTYHTLIVAIAATIIFIAFVFFFQSVTVNVEGQFDSSLAPVGAPGPI